MMVTGLAARSSEERNEAVVAPGFLANPEVRRWLDDTEPAWTMLEYESFNALHAEPSANNEAIRLKPDLTETDLVGSAVLRTARILLQRAEDQGGLKLIATGNLSRQVVSEMIEIIEWPDFDKEKAFELHKVINEPDFLPVHFIRLLLQETKLLRTQRTSWCSPAWARKCPQPSSTAPFKPFYSTSPFGM